MSSKQTFNGQFTFADAHCLEAGLDRFAAAIGKSLVGLNDLSFDGLTVGVDKVCSAPESKYDATSTALSELGSEALSGSITGTFTLHGTASELLRPGATHRRPLGQRRCRSLRTRRWPSACSTRGPTRLAWSTTRR